MELELHFAHHDLIAWLEAHPLKRCDHADLAQPTLEVIQSLRVFEIVTRDQQLDTASRHPEPPIALSDHLESLGLTGPVDPVLGLELPTRRGSRLRLGQCGEDRADQLVQAAAGRRRDTEDCVGLRTMPSPPGRDQPLGPLAVSSAQRDGLCAGRDIRQTFDYAEIPGLAGVIVFDI